MNLLAVQKIFYVLKQKVLTFFVDKNLKSDNNKNATNKFKCFNLTNSLAE